jgi:hypothetical protein
MEVERAVAAGTEDALDALPPYPEWMQVFALKDLLFLVRRLVCDPEYGTRVPAMLRLALVDGALLQEEAKVEDKSGALPVWKAHVVSVIKLGDQAREGVDVALLDGAGPDPARRVHALTRLLSSGASVATVAGVVRTGYSLDPNGAGGDKEVCTVYKMAAQMMIQGAMQGQSIEPLRLCLQAIQQADGAIGEALAGAIRPSLEMCFEHSATPWALEEMATAFVDGNAV